MHKEKAMRVGLFVPCYVDAFHPDVGIATLELLERLGVGELCVFERRERRLEPIAGGPQASAAGERQRGG